MASGRNPSMLRMITRLMAGWGVCVIVGIGVNVNVKVGVIGDAVGTGVDVRGKSDAWHPNKSIERKTHIKKGW
jgi:hypothetical protein